MMYCSTSQSDAAAPDNRRRDFWRMCLLSCPLAAQHVCRGGPSGRCVGTDGDAAVMSRPSRLQRQVLSLYRELLRAGRGKPGAEARVRAEFRQHASLPRSDVLRIEYLYRRGRRQLQLLRSGHATAMGTFVRPRGPTEEPGDVTAPETRLDDGGAPKNSCEGTGDAVR